MMHVSKLVRNGRSANYLQTCMLTASWELQLFVRHHLYNACMYRI